MISFHERQLAASLVARHLLLVVFNNLLGDPQTLSRNRATKNFESSLKELERIVREMEGGDLPLERSLELFEQGVKLSRECQERLTEAERRIEVLLRDAEGRPAIGRAPLAAVPADADGDDEEDDDEDVF